ncbi:Dabb family protein [Cohnella sp.]|uniref:Dabb family protein n=1 Tax=Cohnella sp. TaxID=1883426 RepID=UPI003565D2B7
MDEGALPIEAAPKPKINRNLGGSKMFEHIVLLKFKPDVSIEVKESAIKRAHDFKGNIPGIVELSAGINVTEEIEHMQGFTLAIRVTFEDQKACRDYIQHPLHQSLLQFIGPFVDGIVVMDYPFA